MILYFNDPAVEVFTMVQQFMTSNLFINVFKQIIYLALAYTYFICAQT